MVRHRALIQVRTRSRLAAAIVVGSLASSAAPRIARAEAPTAAQPERAELALDIEPQVAGLDAVDVRAAIERELEIPTTDAGSSSTAVLRIRGLGGRRVETSFRQANGRRVEREIELPEERDRALETIGLLSANLVRNEAAELVAAMLQQQRPAPEPAAVPPPPAYAPPAVAPAEPAPCKRRDGYNFVNWGADVAPFVGTSRWEPPRTVRRLSLEVAGGYSEGVHGVGLSLLVHQSSKFVCGAQIATIGNVVGGPVEGAQLANIFNYAHDVKGMQGSLVNVAFGQVRGVQVGLVNVADDSDFSFGLINVMRKGRIGVDGFGAETGFFSFALKNGGSHWHNFYGVTSRKTDQGQQFGYLFGLGAHITTRRHFFFLDLDGLVNVLPNPQGGFPDRSGGGWLAQVRGVVGIHPIPIVSIYAGPTYNAYVTEDLLAEPLTRSRLAATYESRSFSYSRWPGFMAGIQLMSGN
jgi:hypothetical protein